MTPTEQKHFNEVRNSIDLMKNEDARNNYGNHATAIKVLEAHLAALTAANAVSAEPQYSTSQFSSLANQAHGFSSVQPLKVTDLGRYALEPQAEQVDLYGTKDGVLVHLGKAAMPPRMKARELAREQFGHFEDDDGSDADSCFYALERLIEYMYAQGFKITHPQATEPAGFKLVPVELTPEMCDAARWSEYGEETRRQYEVSNEFIQSVWASLLAAAPEQKP